MSDGAATGRRRSPARWVEGVATALFTMVVAWPFLSATQYMTTFDTVTYSGPNLAFTFDQWRAGRLPEWNDRIFGGIPHLANPQVAGLYPLKLLFLPFGPARALSLITAAHLAILGSGLWFLLARRLRLRPPAAFVGTAVTLGSGLIMVRSIQAEQIAVIAWIPWVLTAVDWAVSSDRLRPRAVAAVGAAVGALLLAGHPNQVYIALPLLGGWALARSADRVRTDSQPSVADPGGDGATRPASVRFGRRIVVVALGVLLGTGLAAAQLAVTARELSASVNTAGRSLASVSINHIAVDPAAIPVTLLGNAFEADPELAPTNAESLGFVGAGALVLAVVGLAAALAGRRTERARPAASRNPTGARGGAVPTSEQAGTGQAGTERGRPTALRDRVGPARAGDPRRERVGSERATTDDAADRIATVGKGPLGPQPWRWTGGLLALLCVTGLILALGPLCPPAGDGACSPGGAPFRLLFDHLPGFSQGRVPGRWMLLASFSLALLAAVGVDALARRAVGRSAVLLTGAIAAALAVVAVAGRAELPFAATDFRVWLATGLATALAVAVAVAGTGPSAAADGPPDRSPPSRRRITLTGPAVVVAAALATVPLAVGSLDSLARQDLQDRPFDAEAGAVADFLAARPERVLSLAGSPMTDLDYLTSSMRPNANATAGVRSLDGYDGGLWVRRPWVTAGGAFSPKPFDADLTLAAQTSIEPDPQLLARYGVRWLVVDLVDLAKAYGVTDPDRATERAAAARAAVPDYRGPVAEDGAFAVFENPRWTGEARVAYETVPAADSAGVTERLRTAGPDQAVVESGGPALTCPGCQATRVALDRQQPGSISASFTAERDGLLVIPEQRDPGWRATLDGSPVEPVAVDGTSQGIPVTAGPHTVELTYRAPGLRPGLAVSGMSLVVLAVLAWEPAWLRRRWRRTRRADDSGRR